MTLDELLNIKINKPNENIRKAAKEHFNRIAKPLDSLGVFEDMLCNIAAAQEKEIPDMSKKALLIMCADNGIVDEGVSQSGREVTEAVASLMGEGKSSVGILTKNYPMDIFVYDVGMVCEDTPGGVINKKVCRGTKDFLKEPAMSVLQCLSAIETGIGAALMCREKDIGIIATGEMGIGNTTTSTALLCALCGARPEDHTGYGAGLSREGLMTKVRVISEGLRLYAGDDKGDGKCGAKCGGKEAFEMLRCLGGLDIAALTGVFIGAARCGIPVVIDGLISAVAALTAERLIPGCREYMTASHIGKEKGMEIILDELSLRPVINADMALGEGTGAVMLFPLLDMVFSLYLEGTTFQKTSIGQYERHEL